MRLRVLHVQDVADYRLCHGCGACAYACESGAVELRNFIDEGIRPVVDSNKCTGCGACTDVCSGVRHGHAKETWPEGVLAELSGTWGPVLEVWEGHAADGEIRFRGGSGGVATALALYCMEVEGAGGALHVRMDPERPWLNKTVISESREALLAATGSRYAPASPCAELDLIERSPSPVVFIGKPCDVASASHARKRRPALDAKLSATISIFCGGTPSTRGTYALLEALGVNKEDVSELRYRGLGWPGMTGVGLRAQPSVRREMPYRDAWDHILTKHVQFRCKICPDGTGEFADIACGDPWYREIGKHESGSTLVIVRTERGRALLRGAMEAGYVSLDRRQPDVLPRSQRGLEMRRRGVWAKMMWAVLVGYPFPAFRGMNLFRNWIGLPAGRKWSSIHRGARYVISLRRKGRVARTPAQVACAESVARLSRGAGERRGACDLIGATR